MVINNRPVSDNILRIISERGYKQSAVARKAGYSRQTFGYMVHAPNENAVTVQKTVEALTGEYRNRLEEISNTIQHDRQDIV